MWIEFNKLSPPSKDKEYNWKVHDFISGVCILLVPLLFISWVVWELL